MGKSRMQSEASWREVKLYNMFYAGQMNHRKSHCNHAKQTSVLMSHFLREKTPPLSATDYFQPLSSIFASLNRKCDANTNVLVCCAML